MESSPAKTEAASKLESVTRVKCANGRLMASNRSPLIKAMWIKEAETPMLHKTLVKTFTKRTTHLKFHQVRLFSSKRRIRAVEGPRQLNLLRLARRVQCLTCELSAELSF